MDAAYGPSRPVDPDMATQAKQKAYADAKDCRTKAADFWAKYNGVKCSAIKDGESTTVDVNATMTKVIKAMDAVPVP